ncbi:HpcH/HpaI aldolase/citrate lyase family protein [Simplicispira psychrophila]|uniref:HpcH/HpaI aldolase/citrate lyase family protein n=1 Tax=Simplicispira psychrophila TaxID=80882 RepID=UPI0004879979|nr:HpcH/HpaI aldolase/citrate lyase family protein [Simplicispira psychrophila]
MPNADNLGASLYVPATHPQLTAIAAGEKLEQVRSVIFCTEDAVHPRDLPGALANLAVALLALRPEAQRQRFIRVRSPEVLQQVLALPGIQHIDGFVLPKATALNMPQYMHLLSATQHSLMPTLESVEVFDDHELLRLRLVLQQPAWRARILVLRIGGNDLLSLLGLRRQRGHTLYETPVGAVIARLVTTFKPYGFRLSAPVFEYLDDDATLEREVRQDLLHGLTGKTAIHPDQVPRIERYYSARHSDLAAARRILDPDAAGVFQFDNAMCEPTTHRNWALSVVQAEQHYGTA